MAKRTILAATVTRDAKGNYSTRSQLGMSEATADDSQTAACNFAEVANAQLDFSGSKYRLGMFDTETGERMVWKKREAKP